MGLRLDGFIADIRSLTNGVSRVTLTKQLKLRQLLNKLEALIMATQEDLLAAVAAGKAELLATVESEKVQTLEKVAALDAKIVELEAVIAAGGDTQPAIDALKAANDEVKAAVEGITV